MLTHLFAMLFILYNQMFAVCNILFVVHYYLLITFNFLFVENNHLFMFLKYLFSESEINYLVSKNTLKIYNANIGKCGLVLKILS